MEKGNTEVLVDYITKITGAKSFKIEPRIAYPENYEETVRIANEEKSANSRPEIKEALSSVDDYDIILLGYPIWHGNLPNIVMTQLENLNFDGKVIFPFNTHEGSGKGTSISDIKNCVGGGATVKDGFSLKGSEARKEENYGAVREWLEEEVEVELNSGWSLRVAWALVVGMVLGLI